MFLCTLFPSWPTVVMSHTWRFVTCVTVFYIQFYESSLQITWIWLFYLNSWWRLIDKMKGHQKLIMIIACRLTFRGKSSRVWHEKLHFWKYDNFLLTWVIDYSCWGYTTESLESSDDHQILQFRVTYHLYLIRSLIPVFGQNFQKNSPNFLDRY